MFVQDIDRKDAALKEMAAELKAREDAEDEVLNLQKENKKVSPVHIKEVCLILQFAMFNFIKTY